MKKNEILKLSLFSIATAVLIRYISISIIWKNLEVYKNNFNNNVISLHTYLEKTTESFNLEIASMFVLPYVVAIPFYFLSKINLSSKYNFLTFLLLFTILFYLFYILIGYVYTIAK